MHTSTFYECNDNKLGLNDSEKGCQLREQKLYFLGYQDLLLQLIKKKENHNQYSNVNLL